MKTKLLIILLMAMLAAAALGGVLAAKPLRIQVLSENNEADRSRVIETFKMQICKVV